MANIEARKDKDGNIVSYRIKVFKGRNSEGKRIKPDMMTWKVPQGWSEKKIQKKLNEIATIFENESKKGLIVNNHQTFSAYAEYVLKLKEQNGVKHKTIESYKNLLERINIAIGHFKIKDLKPQHLNDFYTQLAQDGMNLTTGGKLSAKTIKEHHNVINTILKQAEKEMLVLYNAAAKSSPPKNKKKKVDIADTLETEEIKTIFEILEQEPFKWRMVIQLLAASGCRRGEILGLKWENVDFRNNLIFINNNSLYTKEKGIYEETPKTESSIRYIAIPVKTMKLLKQYRKLYLKQKIAMGNKWIEKDFIFTQENGLPMHPDSPTGYCVKLQKKYNELIAEKNKKLPRNKKKREIHISPHIFRHSQASILIYLGVDPVTVSKRLGHAQVSTTSDIYSHIMQKADQESADKLDRIFG